MEQGFLAAGDGRFEVALEGVGRGPDGLAVLGLELGERAENAGEGARFAAEDLGLQILQRACVRLLDVAETLPQRVDGCQEVLGQSAFFATSARCPNACGSRTARSARIFRLTSTPARRKPFIRRL